VVFVSKPKQVFWVCSVVVKLVNKVYGCVWNPWNIIGFSNDLALSDSSANWSVKIFRVLNGAMCYSTMTHCKVVPRKPSA
jgi:hypothetical protein